MRTIGLIGGMSWGRQFLAEIGLLVGKAPAAVPLFDSTLIHVAAAVRLALIDNITTDKAP